MSKWNGKIKCVGMADKSGWANYTKGKIYDVKNGVIITDSGMSVNGESFEYFCDKSCARWEEVFDDDLRELLKPCMLVRCKDSLLRMVIQCEDKLIIKRFDSNGWIDISDYNDDLTLAKREKEELDIIEIYGYEKAHSLI